MFQFAQNEATNTRRRIFFYAVDSTDGFTAVTASITSGAVLIVKNGVTPGTTPVSPTFTHISNGLWYYEMTATHLDTQGVLTVTITGTNIRTVQLIGYVYAGDPMASIPSFPTNFSSLAINGSGQVTVGGYASGQAPLQPTVAGRTLDVTLTGEAGIDWGNIGSPTTTVNFTGTTISSVTNAVTVGTINNNVITAASIATDAIDSDAIANSAITIRLSTDGTASEGRIVAGTTAADVWSALVSTYDPTSTNTTATMGKAILKSDTSAKNGDVTMYSIAGTNGIDVDIHRIANDQTAATNLKAMLMNTSTITLGAQLNTTGNLAIWERDISGVSISGQAGRYVTDGAIAATNGASSAANIEGVAYRESIADTLLGRNIAGGSNTGRLVKEALYALRNKSEISGSTLNVYNATDSAIAWTATVASSAGANPVTGIDPP